MNIKRRRQKPRLDRRNANKNIDYDALNSSPSSFDDESTSRDTSLDLSTDSGTTSFRIEGTDGQFDRICRSLGLSGPDDFSIPTAAWEARRAGFCADYLSCSRDRHNSVKSENKESPKDFSSNEFEVKVRFSDELKRESECCQLKTVTDLAKVETRNRENDEISQENDDCAILSVRINSDDVRCSRNGGCGIKGDRPPVLAPPPAMALSVVDNVSSTWDIFRSFGPQDEKDLYSPIEDEIISSANEVEVNEEVEDQNLGERELDGSRLRSTAVPSDSCSDTSNDYHEDDSFSMSMDSVHWISPNGNLKRRINSWQKGDFLGRGSFGTVYEGYTDDGIFFAVKEVSLLDQGNQGKQSIYQLEQEISLLSQFEHENIVRYLGTDKDDGNLYIFLELVTKGSLANLYQKYELRDSQVSAYTRQILSGLSYLHGRNVVHRDIKCANILVDVNGFVKLADFGLAKATKLNDIKSCKGTAFWMAPEVVNRKNHGYGLAADIWSLGCTVLEMLTRHIPYSHLEGMQALFRIGRGEPPPIPSSLSRDAQDFILKCLQVNPDQRPTAAQLLEHPFVKRPQSTNLGLATPASPDYYGIRS